ncbi:hypothetical protein Hdeb2414_s0012g00395541 [Helianthus debilis subsp. tardiflorus]
MFPIRECDRETDLTKWENHLIAKSGQGIVNWLESRLVLFIKLVETLLVYDVSCTSWINEYVLCFIMADYTGNDDGSCGARTAAHYRENDLLLLPRRLIGALAFLFRAISRSVDHVSL